MFSKRSFQIKACILTWIAEILKNNKNICVIVLRNIVQKCNMFIEEMKRTFLPSNGSCSVLLNLLTELTCQKAYLSFWTSFQIVNCDPS